MKRVVLLLSVFAAAACGPPDADREARTTLELGEVLGGADTLHARAVTPRAFTFPADHGPHPEFRSEWWYFTGNVTTDDGDEFGYQLTFFRSALADTTSFVVELDPSTAPDVTIPRPSPWRTRHAYMAHFAVSDIGASRIHSAERFARAALDLAGAEATPFRVWLEDWRATGPATTAVLDTAAGAGTFPLQLTAATHDIAIDLRLTQGKPIVLQGESGFSRKGPEPGNASYYYSLTRMPTTGTIRIGGAVYDVVGYSWLDREWSTSALGPELEGWDWMALQLDDAYELMLYRLRRHDGGVDPFSAGMHVAPDGATQPLRADDFTMDAERSWRSPIDGTAYPVDWRVQVPALALDLAVRAAFDAQELDHAVRYWEGAVGISGTRGGIAVEGRGYLEMTGYAGTRSDRPPR
jgi:predicted secreted hydrolase